MKVRVATWNLEVPGPTKASRQAGFIGSVAADLWVLTESHDRVALDAYHTHSSAPGRDTDEDPATHWVTIASRFPLQPLAVEDERRTAACLVSVPEVAVPLLVFGTVLPWGNDCWRGHASADGEAFAAALRLQSADWNRLRRDSREAELFVIGDFNQDLDQTHYSGSRRKRALLTAALTESGLFALTAGDTDPVRRDSPTHASIDHICVQSDSAWQLESSMRWPEAEAPDPNVSDHFGASVVLSNKFSQLSRQPL